MSKLYDRIMGSPLVYDYLRPFLLGGITVRPAYEMLLPVKNEKILDVGCGTGIALKYLSEFAEYHGFDTDTVALNAFKKKYRDYPGLNIYNLQVTRRDVERIDPHKILLMGLLHHLDDNAAVTLMESFAYAKSLKRIVSTDVYYKKGLRYLTGNALARFDRGQYVRTPEEYKALIEKCGFVLERDMYLRSGNKLACYYIMCMRKK